MFTLIHRHTDFVVVNKHQEISVHKDKNEHAFVTHVEESLQIKKLYLVHRLDKMTSGLLLLATSSEACARLANLFATRQISKFYLAISATKPKKKQGLVSGDMEKSRRSAWKLMKREDDPAITQFFSAAAGEGRRIFLCKPYTGKTHQIRVALNSLGAAVCGDPIYQLHSSFQYDRGYLHAYSLQFDYLGEEWAFFSDPSLSDDLGVLWHTDEVKQAIHTWQSPCSLPWPQLSSRLTHLLQPK